MEASNANVSEILKGPPLKHSFDGKGMGEVFFTRMLENGDAVAQIDGVTLQRDTYKSLLQRCVRTAIAMRSKGMTPSDVATICSSNSFNSCVPFIASLFLGVKPANLDPTISLTETIYLLQLVKPKMVFACAEAVKLIEEATQEANFTTEIVVLGNSLHHSTFDEFLKPSDEEQSFRPITVEDDQSTAAFFFSSGTTGLPKGICLNHFTLLSQGYLFSQSGYDVNVFLSLASLYWISAAMALTACVYKKGCRVIVSKCDPKTLWELVGKLEITAMFLSPFVTTEMCKYGRPEEARTASLKQILIGGGFLLAHQIKAVRRTFPGTHVALGYGLTETGGSAALFLPKEPEDMRMANNKPESSGKILCGRSYKVVDIDTGNLLGPYQKGELRIKTKLQLNGYYKQDSSGIWDLDGFLKTGDVAYYDEDGCFYIVDRIKEMLKYKSWHVSPGLIEGVLLTHPAVASAAVVGLPHPVDGDHPVGIVAVRDSFKDKICCAEIEQYVERKVDDRMRLRGGVKIIDCMPLTPSGKVKKRDVKDMVINGLI